MIAFDADVYALLLAGEPSVVQRAESLSDTEHWITIVVAEEVLRGRLSAIRRADASSGKRSVQRAYEFLALSLAQLQQLKILPYNQAAEMLFADWRRQKLRLGTRDLRIAAICAAHGAKLISRNRRDFDQVPGLVVEYW